MLPGKLLWRRVTQAAVRATLVVVPHVQPAQGPRVVPVVERLQVGALVAVTSRRRFTSGSLIAPYLRRHT